MSTPTPITSLSVGTTTLTTSHQLVLAQGGDIAYRLPVGDFITGVGSIMGMGSGGFHQTGFFTPTMNFVNTGDALFNFATQFGRYRRLGRHVQFELQIAGSFNAYTTGSGALRIAGLPFTYNPATPAAVTLLTIFPVQFSGTSISYPHSLGGVPMADIRDGAYLTILSNKGFATSEAFTHVNFPSGCAAVVRITGGYEIA